MIEDWEHARGEISNSPPDSVSRQIIHIGLITTLNGPNGAIGRGIRGSLHAALEQAETRIANCPVDFRLSILDDHGDAAEAVRCMEKCRELECVVVFGPNDSGAMSAVLDDPRFALVPKFVTFATATALARKGSKSFFRFTTSNEERVRTLLLKMRELYPGKAAQMYSLVGPAEGFSQSLRADVLALAAGMGITVVDRPFLDDAEKPAFPVATRAPILICAPSAPAVRLIARLRKGGVRGHVFAFGSNSNFLVRKAVGTVVVCDLDRNDSDPTLRLALEAFAKRNAMEKDPSISTMVAIEALVDLVERLPGEVWDNVDTARAAIIDKLQNDAVQGLLGQIRFTPAGEMAGREQISLLCVRRKLLGYAFAPMRRTERPTIYIERPFWRGFIRAGAALLSVVALVSTVTGILSYFDLGPQAVNDLIENQVIPEIRDLGVPVE